MAQGMKIKQGRPPNKAHQPRKRKPEPTKFDRVRDVRKDRAKGGSSLMSTAGIHTKIEATMVGRVLKSQEVLKIVHKTFVREGTVNYGKGKSAKFKMKENRTVREKIVLRK